MKEGFNSIIASKSKRFASYCFSFLCGILVASLIDVHIDWYYILIAGFVLAFCFIIYVHNKTMQYSVLVLLFCCVGVVRYQLAFPLGNEHVSQYTGQDITLEGSIAAEPDVRMDGVRYIVNTQQLTEKHRQLHGRVYIKTGLYPRYSYGDVLAISCALKAPEPIEDFRYDRYLARYGVFAVCQGTKISQTNKQNGNIFLTYILFFKEHIAARINTLWHEPYASFMAGLLYGYRGGLGQLNEFFSRTGVTHIVAISGYNITLISTLLFSFCMRLMIPRKKAFWFVTMGICIFLIFAGLSASVVRAGIMGILVLIARQMGRLSRIGNVLLFTAVIMNVHNPFILVWDAGFQLSFLSTVGLVYLAPRFDRIAVYIPEVAGIRESFVATLSATSITLPLILYQFGRLSIVALPVNMLILWIIPYIMSLGFFAVLGSVIFVPVGNVLAWISWAGMYYIVAIVTWFAGLSFAAVDMTMPLSVMVVSYLLLLYYMFFYKKNRTKMRCK